jgi:hypothetical protein
MYYIIGRITNSVLINFETELEAQQWLNIEDRFIFWYIEKKDGK